MEFFNDPIFSNPYVSGFITNIATEIFKSTAYKLAKSEFISNFKEKLFSLIGKSKKVGNYKIEVKKFDDRFVIRNINDNKEFTIGEKDLEKLAEVIYLFYEKNKSLNGLEEYLRESKIIFGDYIDQRKAHRPIGKVNKYYENINLKDLKDLDD